MEEANQVQTASPQIPIPPPPSSFESLPPQPPKTKKRPFDSDANVSNSTYSKIRAILKDIRPHFLEVLRTPDFQKCKAANKIQEQVKLLMELYKQMTAETLPAPIFKDVLEGQHLSVDNPQDIRVSARSSEHKFPSGISGEKQQAEDGQIKGTYVVGGSAFGWNFITFSGMEPVYYGVTKESFRAQATKLTAL